MLNLIGEFKVQTRRRKRKTKPAQDSFTIKALQRNIDIKQFHQGVLKLVNIFII